MKNLYIDFETYSNMELTACGVRKYVEAKEFKVLLMCYAFDDGEVQVMESPEKEKLQEFFRHCARENKMYVCAHNANFERAVIRYGLGVTEISDTQYRCSMTNALAHGLPPSLASLSSIFNLGENGKLESGTSLIHAFCIPDKATGKPKVVKNRDEKWAQFVQYCKNDVLAERELFKRIPELPDSEKELWCVDQEINDRGIAVDTDFLKNAMTCVSQQKSLITAKLNTLTGLQNSVSNTQFLSWLKEKALFPESITSCSKESLNAILESGELPEVMEAIKLKQLIAKSSVSKYSKILDCLCEDGRVRNQLQFYGAGRTGRWAGRLIQIQNLVRLVGDWEKVKEDAALGVATLTELSNALRSVFVSGSSEELGIVDLSSIEARMLACLAGEKWKLQIFETTGKIYEATAEKMFGLKPGTVTKGSPHRMQGKIAELSLGYGGTAGALSAMDYKNELSDSVKAKMIESWRRANPQIVEFWGKVQECFRAATLAKEGFDVTYKRIQFKRSKNYVSITLPSERSLYYLSPKVIQGRFNAPAISYLGTNPTTHKWERIETFGGKLTGNIVQAASRDVLADKLLRLKRAGLPIVFHVHDEIVWELKDKDELNFVSKVFRRRLDWLPDLPLDCEVFSSKAYSK
jgi:DNA polymerase